MTREMEASTPVREETSSVCLPAATFPMRGRLLGKRYQNRRFLRRFFMLRRAISKAFSGPVFWLVSGEQVLHIGDNSGNDSVEKTGEFWYNILVKNNRFQEEKP